MAELPSKTHKTVAAALALNRGELDAARLAALLHRLAAEAPRSPAKAV